MSRRRPIKCRQNCGAFQNYHPILDSCRKGKSVRDPKVCREGCGEWEKDE